MSTNINHFSIEGDISKFKIIFVIFMAIAGQLLPSAIYVGMTILSVLFFIQEKKNNFIVLSLTLLCSLVTTDLPLNDIITPTVIVAICFLSRKNLRINKASFLCIILMMFYLFVTVLHTLNSDVDMLFLDYFKKNIYKELVFVIVFILLFSTNDFELKDFLYANVFVAFSISMSQIVAYVIGINDFAYSSYQLTISCLLILFSTSLLVKWACLFNVVMYVFFTLLGSIYFSSQHIMLIILVIVLYMLIYKRIWFLFCLFFLLFLTVFSSFNLDVYTSLKSFGIAPGIAFKISQLFIVLNNLDIASIPWSPRVRIIEFVNTFDRNIFSNLFGSGYVSYIEESYMPFIINSYDQIGLNDFSQVEINMGKFYGLHNTSRGLLHYGLSYFVFAIVIFIFNLRVLDKFKSDRESKMFNIFIFSMAVWNPSVFFLFLLLTGIYFKSEGKIEKIGESTENSI